MARSPYTILGVDPSSTPAEIRDGYKQALRAGQYRRDEITSAFAALRNPLHRAECDLWEPEPAVTRELRALVNAQGAGSVIDDETIPLPPWDALVVPPTSHCQLPDPDPHRDQAASVHDGLTAAPADVVPPPEFPL